MTIDILEGDLLVVGGREYPVVTVDNFSTEKLNTSAFARMATLTASTKRQTASGTRLPASNHLTGLKCTPLDAVSLRPSLRTTYPDKAVKTLETFICDADGFVRIEVEQEK